jgi:hypothetical protein
MIEEKHIQAAIIGYHRSGLMVTEISNVAGVTLDYVVWVIQKYFYEPA